jgi:hypothetical protein
MRRVLRAIGWLLVALAGAAGFTAFVARHADGPIGPFLGGPLVAGELVSGPEPDWSFAAALPTLEIEVGETNPRSRTVWLLVDQGELFVPSGFASHKTWPSEALADPRVVVRVEGRRYARQATRMTDPARLETLRDALGRKYGMRPSSDGSDDTWFFQMGPRPVP